MMFKSIFKVRYDFTVIHSRNITKEIRVRFAPSPTGNLHLGGLRTALYNFLFAKAKGGTFVLRIEDTDQSRVIQGAAEYIQKDLNWAGLYINEGPGIGGNYGPYVQSQRLDIYRRHLRVLLDTDKAYRCFCTSKRLDLVRKVALKARLNMKYDNKCRNLSESEISQKLTERMPHCVRFKLTEGPQTFNDMLYGDVTYDVSQNEGDPIIFKSDGYPTYHFANVVDDYLMEISHVLRGIEWQISTTKHIMIYRAFGWDPPIYGHLPLLLNTDGTKLSKRQGDIQIDFYRSQGIFPLALLNFIVTSGGGFAKDLKQGEKPQIFTTDELAQQFTVNKISVSSGKLNPARLKEFNRLEFIRLVSNEQDLEILVAQVQKLVKETFSERISENTLQFDELYVKSIIKWAVGRINNVHDLVSKQLSFLWVLPSDKLTKSDVHYPIIMKLKDVLQQQENMNKDNLSKLFKTFSQENDVVFGSLMQTVRPILSGMKEGPSVAEMIEILGKENTLLRIEKYIYGLNSLKT